MNKRSIIICSIVAILLLAGIGWLFFSLFFRGEGETVSTDRLTDGVEAVPSDAIFLFEAGTLSEIERLTDDGSALGKLLASVPAAASDWKAALSMHYSSKNAVAPLLVLSLPEDEDADAFMDRILHECGGVVDKRYGSVTVHKSAVPDASFAIYGHFLIASPSLVIVESSLRHLENGTSIKDAPLYARISGVTSDRGVLHLSFDNLGKLFSGAAGAGYVRYASFFQSFADWGAFGEGDGNSPMTFDGRVLGMRAGENLSDVLLTQRGRRPEIFTVAPYSSSYVLTVPITSYQDYIKAYRAYVAAQGKKKDYDYINAVLPSEDAGGMTSAEFVESLKLGEIGVFSAPFEGIGERKILAMRSQDPAGVMGSWSEPVNDYRFKGYVPALLGSVFAPSSEDCWCVLGEWILVGGREELNAVRKDWAQGTYFSLSEYLAQTPAAGELRELSNFSMMINTGRFADTLVSYFKEPYSRILRPHLGVRNFELLAVNMFKVGGSLGVRSSLYREDLAALPQPKGVEDGETPAVVEDVQVTVPGGPFPVKNFIDGSTNYLEQLINHDLRLLNSSRRPVWTVKFDKPLCGTVRQIDYLKNNKLQMLFGAGESIHLLDRLGRTVGRFPISLGKEILLGPDVYDFKGNKDYTLMVLHTDNTLVQYDIDGKPLPGWKPVTLAERIISLPEPLTVGDGRYWVVRTSYQTLIYRADGTICADFSKKRKLTRDTQVEPLSSHEVGVTTADGRAMVLDLNDGSFRKR